MTIDKDFIAEVRSTPVDAELDEIVKTSLKTAGWDENLPAIKDEHGTLLVGNRRLKFALEEGIEPIVRVVPFGEGPEADIARARLAVVSNIGAATLTGTDRKRIAERLYATGMTQEAISKSMGVSRQTITNDLASLPVDGKLPPRTSKRGRKGEGRPKGSGTKAKTGRKTKAEKKAEPPKSKFGDDVERKIAKLVLDDGKSYERASAETGASNIVIRKAVATERGRREARAEAPIDASTLSISAQEKLAAAIRQHKRSLDAEFEQRVQAEVRSRISIVLPQLQRREAEVQRIVGRRRGIMTKANYQLIQSILHPDSRNSVSEERLAGAFRLWTDIEPLVLDETQSPTPPLNMPHTYEDLMARRRAVQEARKAKRGARS